MSKPTKPWPPKAELERFDREIGGYLAGIPVQQTLFDTAPSHYDEAVRKPVRRRKLPVNHRTH